MIPEEDYKKIIEHTVITCIDMAVPNEKGELLLVCRSNEPAKDEWHVPGGRIRKGQVFTTAAVKKLKEETGLEIEFDRVMGVDETIFDTSRYEGMGTHTVNVMVLMKEVNSKDILGQIKIDEHHHGCKFFSEEEYKKFPYKSPYMLRFYEEVRKIKQT